MSHYQAPARHPTKADIAHDALLKLITPEAFSWNVGQTNGGNDDRHRRIAREMVRVAWVIAEEWERRVEGQDTE